VGQSSGNRPVGGLVQAVLAELCAEQGFCLSPAEQARMVGMPTDDLDAFTNAIFAADGLEQPYDRTVWRGVRAHVQRRLGETLR